MDWAVREAPVHLDAGVLPPRAPLLGQRRGAKAVPHQRRPLLPRLLRLLVCTSRPGLRFIVLCVVHVCRDLCRVQQSHHGGWAR